METIDSSHSDRYPSERMILEEAAKVLKCKPEELLEKIRALLDKIHYQKLRIEELKDV